MHLNEKFISAMRTMNSMMKADIKAGKKWKYSNSSSRQEHTFDLARQKGKRYTNCVLAVWWALRMAGVPDSALHWMGGIHKILWTTSKAKAEAKKYFTIISTGGKTVQQLWDKMLLCDGDILMGFAYTHTCVFFGGSTNKKSFDAGHSYTKSGGELAEFKHWIGSLSCKNSSVQYILRLKDRAKYRVQAGAFTSLAEYQKREKLLIDKGFGKPEKKVEDGYYKAQVALCDGLSNANRIAAEVRAKDIEAIVKEVA